MMLNKMVNQAHKYDFNIYIVLDRLYFSTPSSGWDEPPEDSVLGCTSFDNMLRAKTRLCSRKKTFICEAKLDKLTVDRFSK